MAIVIHKGPNVTVGTIAERDSIPRKINNMVATVLDASADLNVETSPATYRYIESSDSWRIESGGALGTSGGGSGDFTPQEKTFLDALTPIDTTASTVPGAINEIVQDISSLTTGDITEGTNLFYTDSRTRQALSASGDLTYNASTGVFEVTTYKTANFNFDFGERTTDDLLEGVNSLYFTDTRSRAALGASGDISYDSVTGVFSVTTYKSADFDIDFGNKSTSDLSEGTNLYYTDVRVRAAISATGDLNYNPLTGEFGVTTYKSTDFDSDFTAKSTDDLSEGTNLYYTDARGRASLSASGDLVYNPTTGEFSVDTYKSTDFDSDFTAKSTDDLSEGTNLYYTDARGRAALSASGDLSYNPSTGVFGVDTYKSGDFDTDFGTKSTDDLSEGVNLYYTDSRVRAALSASGDLAYDSLTGTFGVTTYKSTDFNTDFGAKSTSDLSEGLNLYYTDARVRAALSASGDLAYDSLTGTFGVTTYKSADFNTDFGAKSTGDLSEGVNLYYTDARAISAIKADVDWKATNWDSAYSWGDHALAGYALDSTISAVGKSGSYSDLLNKPDLSVLNDIENYANVGSFPASGESGKIYIAEDSGYMYRWNGSGYTQLTDQTAIWGEISGSLANQVDLKNALDDKLNSSSYTSTDVLNKIKTVDGATSGLDSDLLDGQHGSFYRNATNLNSGTVPIARLPASALIGDTTYSAGSGIDLVGTIFSLSGESYSLAEKNKLGGIDNGAQVNVGTNLGLSGSGNSKTLTSSTGSNVSLPVATTAQAGLMSKGDKSKLNGVESGATADQTKTDIDALNIDADTLDGQHGSYYRNASNINAGTIPEARLPASALFGNTDTTYSAGTGISLSGTTFNVDNPFNPSGNYTGLRAQATTKADVGLGNVPNVNSQDASNLTSGTISEDRLPASALQGATGYSAGTGLSLSGTTFNVDNPFSPTGTYSGLRAQGTTKGDVGLSNVANFSVANYDSRYDSRYLAYNGEAYTATKLADIPETFAFEYPALFNVGGTVRSHPSITFGGSTLTLKVPEIAVGGSTDDGINSLQVAGGARVDTLAAGSVQNPTESIETDGNIKVRNEGQAQMGDFAIQFNSATKSLDFNWTGS